jgi:hypothetical protein
VSSEVYSTLRSALFSDITRRRVVIVPKLRDNVSVPSSRVKSPDGTDTLSRNVGKQLPRDAAYYPRRAQISSSPHMKYFIKFMPLIQPLCHLTSKPNCSLIYLHKFYALYTYNSCVLPEDDPKSVETYSCFNVLIEKLYNTSIVHF